MPIVAAGGIADGVSMAAALVLGAEGVQMGTRMLTAVESPVHDNWKQAVIAAAETDTVIVNRYAKPAMRTLRTELSTAAEREHPRRPLALDGIRDLYFGGSMNATYAMSGQVAGRIDEVLPVRQILDDTWRDCRSAPARARRPGHGLMSGAGAARPRIGVAAAVPARRARRARDRRGDPGAGRAGGGCRVRRCHDERASRRVPRLPAQPAARRGLVPRRDGPRLGRAVPAPAPAAGDRAGGRGRRVARRPLPRSRRGRRRGRRARGGLRDRPPVDGRAHRPVRRAADGAGRDPVRSRRSARSGTTPRCVHSRRDPYRW